MEARCFECGTTLVHSDTYMAEDVLTVEGYEVSWQKVDPQAAAAASGEEDITEGGDNQGGNNNPPSGELEG